MLTASVPSTFRVCRADEFIGPARKWADKLIEQVSKSTAHGRPPIKRLILGPSGIGKSSLAEFFCQLVAAQKWCRYEFNGTDFRLEDADDIERTVHFTNMYGDYRVIRIEEVDRVPALAQVKMLTLLDNLPPGNAVICTSNCSVKQLEPRFHRRFQVIELQPPSNEEVEAFLLNHWPKIGQANARQIATFAQGNVGQALMDAEDLV